MLTDMDVSGIPWPLLSWTSYFRSSRSGYEFPPETHPGLTMRLSDLSQRAFRNLCHFCVWLQDTFVSDLSKRPPVTLVCPTGGSLGSVCHKGLLRAALLILVGPGLALAADGPLPLKDAAAAIQVPPEFQATLFAGEPDVAQPMSISFDDRGRMWVVECRSYPKWLPANAKEGKDRILILHDTDGDGKFDVRKVFLDQGVNISSAEWGFGGVFVTAVPRLLFIPDANGDDVPDGPPQVLLDGFDLEAVHNVVNGLVWGPDGWLYGCNGILSKSRVGKPGAPDSERIPMNCGIWRYHPTRQVFEVVAHGTTNPWGLAFDDRGEGFLTNCVIEHAFHVVPGARFKRMFGQDFNPRTFELMQTCADHIHWAGGTWEGSRSGTGKHGEAGGGHAHSGAMIYLGDQFPADYRNCLFTLNIHGQRLNVDKLERSGSGYVARHRPDFGQSKDPWFRGVCVKQGPQCALCHRRPVGGLLPASV